MRLEFRLCAELEGMPDRDHRRYWCDGFLPEDYRLDAAPPCITGRVWLGVGSRGMEEWRFTLLLPEPTLPEDDSAWDKLLPSLDETEWVTVDPTTKNLTLDPAAAVPHASKPRSENG